MTDVYVVRNRLTRRTEVWFLDISTRKPEVVRRQRVMEVGDFPTGDLAFLDIDGDGQTETLVGRAGADNVSAAIIKPEAVPELGRIDNPVSGSARIEIEGGVSGHREVFANIDADQPMELIRYVSGAKLSVGRLDEKWPGFAQDETAYFVYELENGAYRLDRVERWDPVHY